jgi:hypothetical protein
MILFEGILSGLIAGILMGLISHTGFKAGIFKSSLFIIDGSFVQNVLRLERGGKKAVLLGIPVHLLTSASFGIGYIVFVTIFKLDLHSGWLIALYTLMLWLSMLFVALPTAGQGVLGRKLGPYTWLEQMVLHVFFAFGLWGFLNFLN